MGRRSAALFLFALLAMVGLPVVAADVCTANLVGVSGFGSFAGVGFQANPAARLSGTLNGQPDNNPGNYRAEIDWEGNGQFQAADLVPLGNGNFLVKGSHIYDRQGTYRAMVKATGACGNSVGPQPTVTVAVSPMPSGIPGQPSNPVAYSRPPSNVTVNLVGVSEFSSFAGVGFRANLVARLSGTLNGQPDNEVGDFHAQVNWGDSDQWENADLVLLGNGNYQVKGSHVYAQQGTYPVVVYVNGPDGTSTARKTVSVTVSPMPSGIPGTPPDAAAGSLPASEVTVSLVGVSGFSTQATVGFETNLVARLSGTLNGQSDNEVGDFQAWINWGDGNSWDSGQILFANGSMTVYGSHVYATQGTYPVVVYASGPDGTSISRRTVTVTVTPAPPKPSQPNPRPNPQPDPQPNPQPDPQPNPQPDPQAECLNTSHPITHGPLHGFVTEFNRLIDSVPGLGDALVNGQVLIQRMADDLVNEYSFTKSPYAGLRLIRDALLSEFSVGAKLGNAAPSELAVNHLKHLTTKGVPASERRLAGWITKTERAEDHAVAVCLSKSVAKPAKRLKTLTDLKKIANLKNVERGANGRINKIVYELDRADKLGLDVTQVLSDVLDANGFSGLAKELTLNNLLENFKAAKAVNALTPDNLKRLSVGASALLDNGVKLDIDHIVPVKLAREVGKTLANLRLTPVPINRSMQDVVTESVVEYARLLKQAKLLKAGSLRKVEKAVRYVR